jgi:hypothetical protein
MVNMTKVYRPITGVFIVFGFLATASVALADSTTDPTREPVVDPNAGFSSPEGGGNLFNDSSGPMDLIHRAVLMNDMSLSDFQRQQQNRFADEAANFRMLQQEALQQQQTNPSAVEAAEETDLDLQ